MKIRKEMELMFTLAFAVINLCNLFSKINTEVVIFENTTTTNELVSLYENSTKMRTNEFTEVEIDHALTHEALRRKPKTNFRHPKTLFQSLKLDYTIWPKPNSVSMSHKFMLINIASFKIIPSSDCLIINTAITRYREKMFIQDCSRLDFNFRGKNLFYQNKSPLNRRVAENVGQLKALHLIWSGQCEKNPQMNMNEAYQISVDKTERGAEIKALSIWGILRGLETFSQLLENVAYNEFKVHLVSISDAPRFAHRQLMIDTSRHFLSVRSILKTLDAMEMNKLNVLHWHVADDQSFPFVSESYPQLARNGSWSPTHIYTVQDVEKIIDHARLRGIRILAEFDTPGHTLAWGKGIPSLLTQCFENGKPNGQLGPFDPTKKSTYDFLQVFYSEIARRFPDQYLHLGGDEVNTKCWASNPSIKRFMKEHNFKRLSQLETYYIQRLVDLVGGRLKRSYIVWQDVFDEGVQIAPDTLVHVWIEKRNGGWRWKMDQVTKAGYLAILSAPWYLETAYTEAWREYYETDPLDWDGSEEQKRRVLGGGACMWGEYVDGGNVLNKIWTTTAAVAEKLWSQKEATKEAAKAARRFHAQHCRMQTAGIRVGPLDGPGYCPCDFAVY